MVSLESDRDLSEEFNTIYIRAYKGLPGKGMQWVGSTLVDLESGKFDLPDLSSDSYFLLAEATDNSNSTFWNYWSRSGTVLERQDATPFYLKPGQHDLYKDFQLIEPNYYTETPTIPTGSAKLSGTVSGFDSSARCGEVVLRIMLPPVTPVPDDSPIPCFVKNAPLDANGNFAFEGLGEGDYSLFINPCDLTYLNKWWTEDGGSYDSPEIINIEEGVNYTGIDFQIEKTAHVSGTVFKEDGVTPVPGIQIYLLKCGVTCDDIVGEHEVFSDNDGTFAFNSQIPIANNYHIFPGKYLLLANSSYIDMDYEIGYWSSKLKTVPREEATIMIIQPGDSFNNLDFHLNKGATLGGSVNSPNENENSFCYSYIEAYAGNPCSKPIRISNRYHDAGDDRTESPDGIYKINRLAEGTYYLKVRSPGCIADTDQWYTGGVSSADCSLAKPIVISEGEYRTDLDFDADEVNSVSGTLYNESGTKVLNQSGVGIEAYTGDPCKLERDATKLGMATAYMPKGYTFEGLPVGSFYLKTSSLYDHQYVDVWWSEEGSITDCSKADQITISENSKIEGIDFSIPYRYSLRGDFNRDDAVSVSDLIVALRVFAGKNRYEAYISGDTNGDNRLDMSDVLNLMRDLSQDPDTGK